MKLLMSNKDFVLYCVIFCEKFRGKTFGEVIPDFRNDLVDTLIIFEDFKIYGFSGGLTLDNHNRSTLLSNEFGYFIHSFSVHMPLCSSKRLIDIPFEDIV